MGLISKIEHDLRIAREDHITAFVKAYKIQNQKLLRLRKLDMVINIIEDNTNPEQILK